MTELAFNVSNHDEIFAEREGRVSILLDDLAALPLGGDREVLEKIRDYVKSHPKLEARFWRHEGLLGPALVIQWRWR